MNDLPPTPPEGNGTTVPGAMAGYHQFVVWRLEQKPNKPKPDKVLYNPLTGLRASVADPATWTDCLTASSIYQRGGYDGIGFVITKDDSFAFIDLDDCIDPATGQWKPHAQAVINAFPGAWERSQSGKGLHVIGLVPDKAKLADRRRKWTDDGGNKHECYLAGRFVAFGGSGWSGAINADWTDGLGSWLPKMEHQAHSAPFEWVDQPRPGYDGPPDDDELIKRMLASRSAYVTRGTAVSNEALWTADPIELGTHFPDAGGQERSFDHSGADLALANSLAFWTGCNPLRMERLFNRSKLNRNDQRKTRLAIAKAICDPNRSYFSRGQRLKQAAEIGDGNLSDIITKPLTLDEMILDLVFIRGANGVVQRSRKSAQKMESARTDFASSKHQIQTGKIDKVTGEPVLKTVSTFEVWRQSDKYSVDQLTWQPGQPDFCPSLEEQGTAFNTYGPIRRAIPPMDWQTWIDPFTAVVKFLIPIESESSLFLQWLAHAMQKPEELPHTCYLFFTPMHGTGRGTLAEMLARIFEGAAAIGVSPEVITTDGFNGRISRKIVATVDEVREGTRSAHSKEAQKFKSRINEPNRHINPKFGVQSVEKNCCRWLFFSQYEDALPFDNKDRRVIVIANPAEPKQPEWYTWLRQFLNRDEVERSFISSVQHYLATLDISKFNAGAHASMNDAKRRALNAMESAAHKAARQFAETWPAGIATTANLRRFVGDDDWPTSSRAAGELIKYAGMHSTDQKVPTGRTDDDGKPTRDKVLITKPGSFPPMIVKMWSNSQIAELISAARDRFG